MKLPINSEDGPSIRGAPFFYVAKFYYDSGLSRTITAEALKQQCNTMFVEHLAKPTFEDFPEYIEWVRKTGERYIAALDQDFTRNGEWWKTEPNPLKIQERIQLVIRKELKNVEPYSND